MRNPDTIFGKLFDPDLGILLTIKTSVVDPSIFLSDPDSGG
jgi:hypothetical protein